MSDTPESSPARSWLPKVNSTGYYVFLAAIAIFILGPLGGVTAAYMNFSLGFFVGGQVLAGILGSTVTRFYGAEGKHGANYMQTMAASVAGMSGMAVIVQAMVWLGMPEPPAWQLVLYFTCIGFFGVGVGMLYTPILVDKMQLTFPSGLAVANILRALTDAKLLKRSIGQLGAGAAVGFFADLATTLFVKPFGAIALAGNITTIGAGMIVGARITIPAIVVGLIGESMVPYLVSIGWLQEGEPFRKIFFIIALGTILGAAIVDMGLIAVKFVQKLRAGAPAAPAVAEPDWKHVSQTRLILWVVISGVALLFVANQVLNLPLLYVAIAIGLVFVFVMVNGISLGISDSNPISSAFVLTVMLLAGIGLGEPAVAFLCASVVLIACSVGGDMQQDRSTGWRLGTNRVIQFRFQVIGIVMGAIMCVIFAKLFMQAFPVLKVNQHVVTDDPAAAQWQSAMTYKFVGAIIGLTDKKPFIMTALQIGVLIGLVTEALRKVLHASRAYREFTERSKSGYVTGFLVDTVILPTPYASSFGGFVDFGTSVWFGLGGIISSYSQTLEEGARAGRKEQTDTGEELPDDMSTNSLVGGGIIAGASLSALAYGIYELLRTIS
ncbi:MAG: OPT/YSL family transporter [Myxococcales bacterium]|nr:OPT/YSL family transporter [Myxococcales bacterium]